MAKTKKRRYNPPTPNRNRRRSGRARARTATRFSNGGVRSVIAHFLNFLTTLKLFHWDTFIHAEHVASDDIYSKMQAHTDQYVEVMLGKMAQKSAAHVSALRRPFSLQSSPLAMQHEVKRFLDYLNRLSAESRNRPDHSDLESIRDNMRADLNQFLYLLTMK